MKWLISAALVVAFLGWFFFVHIPSPEPGSGAKQDPFCRELLQTKTHREALAWVKESREHDIRTIGEQSPEESSKIVERLYHDGAERAWAVDLESIRTRDNQQTFWWLNFQPIQDCAKSCFGLKLAWLRAKGSTPSAMTVNTLCSSINSRSLFTCSRSRVAQASNFYIR